MHMIDVLQRLREIADRSPEEIGRAIAAAEAMTAKPVAEDKKPDFLDLDKDGNKEEPMSKAAKEKDDGDDKDDDKKGMSAKQEKYFGKKVDEDVQITLSGSDAVLAEILKLAGMIGAKTVKGADAPSMAPEPAPVSAPMGMPSTGPVPSLAAILDRSAPDMSNEPMMDGAYDASTTPEPVVYDSETAIPSGNDLSRAKMTAPRVAPGDNPMQTATSY